MKILLKILACLLAATVGAAAFAACRSGQYITLSTVYPQAADNPPSVSVRAAGVYVGEYVVDDDQTITQIMDVLRERKYYEDYSDENAAVGNEVTITLNYSEPVSLSMRYLYYGGIRYQCQSDGLEDLLVDTGIENGNFVKDDFYQ